MLFNYLKSLYHSNQGLFNKKLLEWEFEIDVKENIAVQYFC